MARVLLVDDHPMILFGLGLLLRDRPELEVVGEARTAEQTRRLADATAPDLIVLPVRLGDRVAGIELCRHLKSQSPVKTLIYTSFTDAEDVQAAMLAGADGLVGKATEPADLLGAITSILRGSRVWLPGPAADQRTAAELLDHPQLTAREREVLALMLERLTNQQIARALTVEVTTVKTHVRSLLRKLGKDSRRGLFSTGPAAVR